MKVKTSSHWHRRERERRQPSDCLYADFIFEDVRQKVESVEGVTTANVQLVFEPEWDVRMMTDEAKLELGML